MLKDVLQEITENAEVDEKIYRYLEERCKEEAARGYNFMQISPWCRIVTREYLGEERIFEFARRNNLKVKKAPFGASDGTAYRLYW